MFVFVCDVDVDVELRRYSDSDTSPPHIRAVRDDAQAGKQVARRDSAARHPKFAKAEQIADDALEQEQSKELSVHNDQTQGPSLSFGGVSTPRPMRALALTF